MLSTQDLLNLSISLGFLVLVGFLCYVCIYLVQSLKSIKKIVDETEEIIGEVKDVKNQIRAGAIAGFGAALSLFNVLMKKKKRG